MEPEDTQENHPGVDPGGLSAEAVALLKEYDYDCLEELEEDIAKSRELSAKFEKDNKQKKKAEEMDKLKRLEALKAEVEKTRLAKPKQ